MIVSIAGARARRSPLIVAEGEREKSPTLLPKESDTESSLLYPALPTVQAEPQAAGSSPIIVFICTPPQMARRRHTKVDVVVLDHDVCAPHARLNGCSGLATVTDLFT